MPAYVQPGPGAIALVFERDGEEPEARLVPRGDGERALLYAVTMLIQQRRLYVGDRLSVRAAIDADVPGFPAVPNQNRGESSPAP
jgi:hypothetical protein